MGVTNENFPNEREEDPNCATNGTPESPSGFNVGSTNPSDILSFMGFMKFLDQPTPACTSAACSPSVQNGQNIFVQVGCAACHTPSLTTGLTSSAALSQKQVNLFSHLAVHHMGSQLADGVTQGSAGPDEFRTAPLWGVGQRIFFLHDDAPATCCRLSWRMAVRIRRQSGWWMYSSPSTNRRNRTY